MENGAWRRAIPPPSIRSSKITRLLRVNFRSRKLARSLIRMEIGLRFRWDDARKSTRKQIFETQLRVVGLQVMRAGNARHVQCFTNRVEMKANDAWRQAHGGNASLLGQTPHGRFAHLQNFGELFRGQKLFAIGHNPSFKFKASSSPST